MLLMPTAGWALQDMPSYGNIEAVGQIYLEIESMHEHASFMIARLHIE